MQSKAVESRRGAAEQWRGRRILLLFVLVTLLPTLAAGLLYWSGWQPQGRNLSFGELLDPVRPLPEIALHSTGGGVKSPSALRGKWLLLAVLDRPCGEACRAMLHAMQQIRLAQGDHMRRVERVVILDQRRKNELAGLASDFRGMQIYLSDGKALSVLARTMADADQNVAERLFIVDPRGDLVMRYPSAANANGVSRDLKRLLRLSRVD